MHISQGKEKIRNKLLHGYISLAVNSDLQDDMLKILGEKHRLYEFLGTLSVKCSYLLFSKEHVKEIILEVSTQKSAGNTPLISSCMNTLVVKKLV